MKFLLDTHALLWFIEGDARISEKARCIIEDTQNEFSVSVASLFEIAIKLKIGKISLQKKIAGFIEDVEAALITIIPIADTHLIAYQNLRDVADHRDPFDRLILATGISEEAAIISIDPKFSQYREEVKVVW